MANSVDPYQMPRFCDIFSRSTLFAQTCVSQYWLLWYCHFLQFDLSVCVLVIILFSRGGGSPVSILRKSISGRHRPVRVADGPMTARCRFT